MKAEQGRFSKLFFEGPESRPHIELPPLTETSRYVLLHTMKEIPDPEKSRSSRYYSRDIE